MNEEDFVNSKSRSSSPPPLKISISRSSSASQVKVPTPLTQIAYEAISVDSAEEGEINIKEKKSKKSSKKKKNKYEERGDKQNSFGLMDSSNEFINDTRTRCQSPIKYSRDEIDLEFTELNERNSSIDGMIDIVETPTSSIQSFSNFKTSNTSLNPNISSKSKRHKSNTSSKTKLNATSRSSSKIMQSGKPKKNKNKLASKLMKQKTQISSNQDEEYINEVKGLSSEEAL
eukprot:jgi/Orpsp1_1/1177184/evm.model.c7180000060486.1